MTILLLILLQTTVSFVCGTICSSEFACQVVGDNVIDVVTDTTEEETCQVTCQNTGLCVFYSWFDLTSSLPNTCILFSSCDVKDVTCSGCYSAPPFCSTTSSTSPVTPTKPCMIKLFFIRLDPSSFKFQSPYSLVQVGTPVDPQRS